VWRVFHARAACSHDLRTPCHGAQCASTLLSARAGVAADGETLYLLHVVRASCRLLLATIGNVLDLNALEAAGAAAASGDDARGGQQQQRASGGERVDVRALLTDVLEVCRDGCAKDVTWLSPLHEELPSPEAPARAHRPMLRCSDIAFSDTSPPWRRARAMWSACGRCC
jgi:signal transduction histidine kinase